MTIVVPDRRLSDDATMKMLKASIRAAHRLAAPSGIAVVDPSGLLRAYVLMDDASPLARDIVVKKARTAAFLGAPTGGIDAALAATIGAAADDFTNLPGGLPVIVEGVVVGGIGAGGLVAEHDVAVAQAGLDALANS